MRKLSPHNHIIKLIEVLYDGPTGRLALVFELMDRNMYEHIKGIFKFDFLEFRFYIFLSRSLIYNIHELRPKKGSKYLES